MTSTDNATDLERHTLIFSDVAVEVVLMTDGEYVVDFRQEGEVVVSFNAENWQDVVRFVRRSIEVTS